MMRRVLSAVVGLTLLAGGPRPFAQERVFAVPANVTVDGVPPIPMTLVDAVAPYGQFRQARLIAWHPTERRLIITTTLGNVPQLHHVRFPGGARTQLTFFADGVSPRPGASVGPKGDYLVFQKDTAGGGEANQLFRYDFANGAITLLTDGKSRNGPPAMSPAGLVAYDSTRRDGKNRDLYVLNPSDRTSDRLVAQMEGAWFALAWSGDEKTILALHVVSSSETHLWRVDAASGQKTLLSPKGDRPVRWAAAAFAPDGQTVYALGNLNGETPRLWRARDGAWTAVSPPDHVLEAFGLAPDGKTVAVVVDLGATSQLQLLDADGRVKQTPAVPPGVISDVQCTRRETRSPSISPARGRSAMSIRLTRRAAGSIAGRRVRWPPAILTRCPMPKS